MSEKKEETEPDVETEELDEKQGSIVMGIINQLRKGGDLHRITLPTFVLEPRAMLERMTDFMAHSDRMTGVALLEDPEERFINIVRYYLSGWHIRPKGVKKPYNSVIGEYFRCRWNLPDGGKSIFVAEQVSHHPPISVYYYNCPKSHIAATGSFRPKSKFYGNSAGTMLNGNTIINMTNRPGEEYVVTYPNVYARGILFGKMLMEMGDTAYIKCEKTKFSAEIEFKTKGFFGGTYNAISGKLKNDATNEIIGYITGKWTGKMYFSKTQPKKGSEEDMELFFDADVPILPKIVAPEEEQEEFESRRLWSKVTKNLLLKDLDAATTEKSIIEQMQREQTKTRESDNIEFMPKFFHCDEQGEYHFAHTIHYESHEKTLEQLESIIFPTEMKKQHGDLQALANTMKTSSIS